MDDPSDYLDGVYGNEAETDNGAAVEDNGSEEEWIIHDGQPEEGSLAATPVKPAPTAAKMSPDSPQNAGAVKDGSAKRTLHVSISPPNQRGLQEPRDVVDDTDDFLEGLRAQKRIRLEAEEIQKKYQNIYRSKPAGSKSVAVKLPNGEQVYLIVREDKSHLGKGTEKPATRKESLLTKPIDDILSAALQKVGGHLAPTSLSRQKRPMEDKLWVDKYRPVNFMDLLSDEGTNREILRWIKSWDGVVFSRPFNTQGVVSKPQMSKPMINKKSAFAPGSKDYKPHFQKPEIPLIGHDGLPIKKIILLSGPPGLGKTTLVHILAKHAGYTPIEINASEDRTSESLQTKIVNAMEIKSSFASQKPSLIILDEIDGAVNDGSTKGAIQTLVNMIQSSSKQSGEMKENESAKSNKKASKGTKITKPIIAICNDPFVPALRPLRQVALNFTLHKTPTTKLANRLQEICHIEGLKTDLQHLIALCELSEHDLRSCLNTLQFLRNNETSLEGKHLLQKKMGKDMKRGQFEIWKDIFRKPVVQHSLNHLRNQYKDGLTKEPKKESIQERIYDSIFSAGDTNRLMEGCFENFLSVKYIDPTMSQTSKCYEWIGMYDMFSHSIQSQQNWALMRYLPVPFVALHTICAEPGEPRITMPRMEYESFQKRQQMKGIINSALQNSPHIRNYVGEKNFAQEYPSYLVDILSTNVKQSNVSLLQAKEQEDLSRCVLAHLATGCSYVASQAYGEESYRLEPQIDLLTTYSGMKFGQYHRQLTNNQRNMIQHQIERLHVLGYDAKNLPNASVVLGLPEKSAKNVGHNPTGPSSKPTGRMTTPEKATARDFFGRVVEFKTPSPDKSRTPTKPAEKPTVYYRFQEGFTNAVRRPFYLKDLFMKDEE